MATVNLLTIEYVAKGDHKGQIRFILGDSTHYFRSFADFFQHFYQVSKGCSFNAIFVKSFQEAVLQLFLHNPGMLVPDKAIKQKYFIALFFSQEVFHQAYIPDKYLDTDIGIFPKDIESLIKYLTKKYSLFFVFERYIHIQDKAAEYPHIRVYPEACEKYCHIVFEPIRDPLNIYSVNYLIQQEIICDSFFKAQKVLNNMFDEKKISQNQYDNMIAQASNFWQ
jgi:hypothetical protein